MTPFSHLVILQVLVNLWVRPRDKCLILRQMLIDGTSMHEWYLVCALTELY